MAMLILLADLLCCYLIGSVNFAIIVTKIAARKDIRDCGSGNAGMTNVIRTLGLLPGIITFMGDVLKGIVAMLVSRMTILPLVYEYSDKSEWLAPQFTIYLCALMCILGHMYPLYFRFKGGKGVASSLGIMFVADWRVSLLGLLTFLVVFLISRIISLSSVTAVVHIVIYTCLLQASNVQPMGIINSQIYATLLIALPSAIIIIKHRDNLKRLACGTEKQLKSKKNGVDKK